MHKIKVVLKDQDKLIISLPDSIGGEQLVGRSATRIRLQPQRREHINYRMRRPGRNLQASSGRTRKAASSNNWERMVEDKVRMIEMHAF